jgi:hypothetical protein
VLKLAVLKLAMKSPEVLRKVAELIGEIQSTSEVMTPEERGRLLSRYWALVREVRLG